MHTNNVAQEILKFLPKGYVSTFLLDEIKPGKIGALKIQIIYTKVYKNNLFLNAYALDFQKDIKINIFNAMAYHKKIFSAHKELYILGKIEENKGISTYIENLYCINNPKIITKINTISLVPKNKGIKYTHIENIISESNLKSALLPSDIIEKILDIFYPTKEFYNDFIANSGFSKAHLDSIKFVEIFNFLQKFLKKRRFFHAKFQCKNDVQTFIHSLPFKLTNSQIKAIQDIKKDLSGKIAAKRIIMGDVGSGKTMVILASVVMAYPHKSMLMAPTSILAIQLYNESQKYLPKNIKVRLVLSSTSKKEDINDADFIIGTQALLYRQYSNEFALVMTDEQHKFGVNQRHKLEQLLQDQTSLFDEHIVKENKNLDNSLLNQKIYTSVKKPHILQFSATPIPRSMSLIFSNIVDYSYLKDLPFKKDITTTILHKNDFKNLMTHINDELLANNQVAVIYPLIEQSDSKYKDYAPLERAKNFWLKNFKNVFYTHGKDKQKEEILRDFSNTRGSILLATTMIEVGISLPYLSIIVIVGAEFLGLASLHQLRGRVSRNGMPGFCYLLTNNIENQRLIDFSKTLDGFEIAELDLKYRSSGDLLDGRFQSGSNFEYFDMQDKVILARANKIVKEIMDKK